MAGRPMGFGEGNLFALRAQTSLRRVGAGHLIRPPGLTSSSAIVVLQALYDSIELDQKKRGVL